MGTFCEAFGVTKIEARSTARKRIQKKSASLKSKDLKDTPSLLLKKNSLSPTPKGNSPAKKKKPFVCCKCGKIGQKAFQYKTEQKINELFSGELEL